MIISSVKKTSILHQKQNTRAGTADCMKKAASEVFLPLPTNLSHGTEEERNHLHGKASCKQQTTVGLPPIMGRKTARTAALQRGWFRRKPKPHVVCGWNEMAGALARQHDALQNNAFGGDK